MPDQPVQVPLGFAEGLFPAGTHICQVVTDDHEREASLLAFLTSGLKSGERAACFTGNTSAETLSTHFEQHGLDYHHCCEHGHFSLSPTREIYFDEDRFDPERMLSLLENFHASSVKDGYPASRVIGEMDPTVKSIAGGERLLEYESRVSKLLQTCPVTAVCQYDARLFDGETIMDVLKVHPMMVVNATVVRNPFYIPPEQFLS